MHKLADYYTINNFFSIHYCNLHFLFGKLVTEIVIRNCKRCGMKKIIGMSILLLSGIKIGACPTCVGRIKSGSQPFFETEVVNQSGKNQSKKFLTVYEQYLQQKKGKQ